MHFLNLYVDIEFSLTEMVLLDVKVDLCIVSIKETPCSVGRMQPITKGNNFFNHFQLVQWLHGEHGNIST